LGGEEEEGAGEGEALEAQKESPKVPEDDHLKILKIRLAKGEITEAEYDRFRDRLSK
jgi:uncharacterized membrane protein